MNLNVVVCMALALLILLLCIAFWDHRKIRKRRHGHQNWLGKNGRDGERGRMGQQGPRGLQGLQGLEGIGTQGAQGIQSSGFQGEQGAQGLQGLNTIGTQGTEGPQGTEGVQGVQGVQGTQGNPGTEGMQGMDGIGTQGTQGIQGIESSGSQGTEGNQGAEGFQGVQGIGTQGAEGNQGVEGIGLQGPQGTQGAQGFQGAQGVVGPQSALEGPQGAQGYQGSQGLQGVVGLEGPQGYQGIVGLQSGLEGPQGTQGPSGLVGPNPFWNQPEWFVNPITGNDTNDGLTPATAVQTIMGGIVARWGTSSPILTVTVTIHLLAPETFQQEEVVLSPILTEGANFIIRGENTLVNTDTISAIVTPLDPTAGTNLTFTLTGGVGAVTPGNLVFNTTQGTYAVVDDISGLIITVTQPFDQVGLTTVSSAPALVPNPAWTAGDNLEFYDRPLLNLKVINPQGGDATAIFGESPVCWLENLYIPSLGGVGNSTLTPMPAACSFVASNCQFDVFVTLDAQYVYVVGQFQNCWLNGGSNLGTFNGTIMGGAVNTAGINYCGFFGGRADFNAILHTWTIVLSPGGYFGLVQADGLMSVQAAAVLEIFRPFVGDPILWGTASLHVTQANASVANATLGGGVLWTTCLLLADTSLFINGLNSGSPFDVGTASYLPAIPITTADLDTYTGLHNPLTGSSFSGPWLE